MLFEHLRVLSGASGPSTSVSTKYVARRLRSQKLSERASLAGKECMRDCTTGGRHSFALDDQPRSAVRAAFLICSQFSLSLFLSLSLCLSALGALSAPKGSIVSDTAAARSHS